MKTLDSIGGGGGGGSNGGGSTRDVRVLVIGSGFSGLGMAIRLRDQGVEDFVVLERADEVGGTWRDNTYPGCACDVAAILYSFSFAPNPHWKSGYGKQAELLEYLKACADRFGVRPYVRFGTDVVAARWNEATQRWHVETSQGDYTAQVLVAATGYLSEPSIPGLKGLDTFEGKVFHSSRWDHSHDLSGRHVAVVGTGASAIQFVPKIQPDVRQLDLYQRTPPWVGPKTDKPMGRLIRKYPRYQRFRRNFNKWGREFIVFAMNRPKFMAKGMQNMASGHLKKNVKDKELRARLTPDYVMGCKRILFSNTWYPTIQQPNVEIVSDGIQEVRPNSIVTADGHEREVDTIILATGFLATNRPIADRLWGREGRTVADAWSDGMEAYRGTTIAGFPNLFMLLGPGTTSPHTSMTVMAEAQINYVIDGLQKMEEQGLATVDVRPDVQTAYNEDLQTKFDNTVWTLEGCKSWYLDSQGRNTTLWPTFSWRFRKITKRFDLASYEVSTPSVQPRHEVPQSV